MLISQIISQKKIITCTTMILYSFLIWIEALVDSNPLLRNITPFSTEEAIEIIIASIFGTCVGSHYALELVTNHIASKINSTSKCMHSMIITKMYRSKTNSSDNNESYDENNGLFPTKGKNTSI